MAISKIRLQDGREYEVSDWTSSVPLWSAVELSTAAFNLLSAFSYGQGGVVPGSMGPRGSTEADTNLEGEGGRMPENEAMIVYGLGIDIYRIGDAAAIVAPDIIATDAPNVGLQDMMRMQRDLIVSMRISETQEYLRAPLGYWPAGAGVAHTLSGTRTDAVAGSTIIAYNGGVGQNAQRRLAAPLFLGPGESFAVDFIAGPGAVVGLAIHADTGRMRLRTMLDGLHKRPMG